MPSEQSTDGIYRMEGPGGGVRYYARRDRGSDLIIVQNSPDAGATECPREDFNDYAKSSDWTLEKVSLEDSPFTEEDLRAD